MHTVEHNFILMVHRGEILLNAVQETHTAKKDLANYLSITRGTLYNYFNKSDIALDIIIQAGKFMNYDFSTLIPELKEYQKTLLKDPEVVYETKLSKVERERDEWKDKYIRALEELNELRKKKNSHQQSPSS